MAQVLVTGATGFLGRNLVERLVQRGDRVRCLMRRPGSDPFLDRLGVEYGRGDILDPASLDGALRGVEVVYHLAGVTRQWGPVSFATANTEGTGHLAEACVRQSKPPVLVFTSSLAAAGPTRPGRPLTEEVLPAPVSEYGRSKLAAEGRLRALADHVPITIVRPPCVFGPWDLNNVWLFRMVWYEFNVVPGRPPPQLSWVYVTDLVDALILVAERGQRLRSHGDGPVAGQGLYYVALDEAPNLADLGRLAARVIGRKVRRTLYLPAPACRLVGRWNDLRARLSGRGVLLGSDKIVEALAGSWLCAGDKAKRELGFVCRTGMAEGLRLTVEWYRAQGWF